MNVVVRPATDADESAWETFVHAAPAATFFHRFPWRRVLERAFGHRCHFLLAERDGEVVGVLPLAEVRSRLFGHKLSGLPFCVYGGIVATSAEAAAALRERACDLARELGVEALELRNPAPSDSGWPVKNLYFTFRKNFESDNARNLKAIPNRQRAMLRKGLKDGLYAEEDSGTERIYRVYSESVRNLGTPVFGRRYLDILREEFGSGCRVLMIRQTPDASPVAGTDDAALVAGVDGSAGGGEDVAGVLSFYFRGEVLPYYGGSVSRARAIRGCNHFMYWELLRRSVEEGILGFDFGRSKHDTGPFEFKKHFGFEPVALPYEYFLVGTDTVPDVNPNNPKYRLLVDTWRRLPLPLANLMGPPLARSLG
ncbi:MAG: FemAB family XrtA/PEP-CTERM system-associated protein [Halieaceae bacterium]|jgi:hypothetical protein|nr:FemAB family XrtA/PEP-CTERM system-associated protein [Halieaceae bacterium]